MPFHRVALLSTALLAPACLVDGEPTSADELGDVEFRCPGCTWGGPMTNTHGLNGLSVSALDTKGEMYDGWRLLSVEIPSDRTFKLLYDVHAEHGALVGTDANGLVYDGKDFIDSRWTVELEATGQTVVMEVVDFDDDDVAANRYTFTGGGGTPNNDKGYTCAMDDETGEYSVVLFDDLDVDPSSGTHFQRADTIYFGCVSGAVGKAALWGYSPWYTDDDTHQTATRTVRADYCGDGTAHTVQGTQLQLTDVLHLHDFTEVEKANEAMWGPSGALCLEATRLGTDPQDILCNGQPLPTCKDNEGFDRWPSALLWTKLWN